MLLFNARHLLSRVLSGKNNELAGAMERRNNAEDGTQIQERINSGAPFLLLLLHLLGGFLCADENPFITELICSSEMFSRQFHLSNEGRRDETKMRQTDRFCPVIVSVNRKLVGRDRNGGSGYLRVY